MKIKVRNSDREIKILLFIWKWKVATTATLAHKFFNHCTTHGGYKGLQRIKKMGLIRNYCDSTGKSFVWMLTPKGFKTISLYLPTLKDTGFKSECINHDLLVSSVQLEKNLLNGQNHLSIITEQQLRRYDEEVLPDWIPRSASHRPDGYWKVKYKDRVNIIALEVEISRKTKSDYENLAYFYDRFPKLTRALWIVPNRHQAERLHKILNNTDYVSTEKHDFVLLQDYYNYYWDSPIILGPEKGKHLGKLIGNSMGIKRETVPYSYILDTRKHPVKKSVYRLFGENEIRLCIGI